MMIVKRDKKYRLLIENKGKKFYRYTNNPSIVEMWINEFLLNDFDKLIIFKNENNSFRQEYEIKKSDNISKIISIFKKISKGEEI